MGERIQGAPNAGLYSPWTPFQDGQRARFRRSLERIYDRFVAVVSAGRRLPLEAVEPVAQGRVWTGRQALEHGLVDHLGGLDTGLERARSLSGLLPAEGRVFHLHLTPSRLSLIRARGLGASSLLGWLGQEGGLTGRLWSSPVQPLAWMPWDLD